MKKAVAIMPVLLCAANIFAKPEFSLSLENSFLMGKANLESLNKSVEPEHYFENDIRGGQTFLAFRSQINKYFSIGVGSGISINRVKLIYYSLDMYEFVNYKFALPYITPLFAELRGILPIHNDLLYFYGGAKLGGAISVYNQTILWEDWLGKQKNEYVFSGGFFIKPEMGLFLKFKNFLIDLGIGYNLQKSKSTEYYYNYTQNIENKKIRENKFYLKQFAVKFGLGFEFGKQNEINNSNKTVN